jgi:hypothetical protein
VGLFVSIPQYERINIMSAKSFVTKFMYSLLSPKPQQVKEVEITDDIVYQADVLDRVAEQFISSLRPDVVSSLNGRLERGLALAKQWSVIRTPVTGKPRSYRVRSSDGYSFYKVDLDARTCECPDSQKGNICKHRIAAYYIEQANKMNPLKPLPIPTSPKSTISKPASPKPATPKPIPATTPLAPKSPTPEEILRRLGYTPEPKVARDDCPPSQTLGSLYRHYLHGEDLPPQPLKVTIQAITREKVMPHPTLPVEEKWCLWVGGLPQGLPNGILFGAKGEHDLLTVFGKVTVSELKGKSLLIHPQLLNIAGKPRYTIRFRGLK